MQMREVKTWLEYSEKNKNAAKDLFYGYRHPKPYEIICFLSQQAAEMAVKAVLIQNGVNVESTEKTHDISRLLESLSLYVENISDELYDAADELFPYSVVTRYPTKLHDIDEAETILAMKNSEKICKWSIHVIEKDLMNYKRVYPLYDDVLPYIAGWRDSSIIDDKMPSISKKYENHILKLTVDYKNQELRCIESKNMKRYTLYYDGDKIIQHNSFDKIKNVINKYK